MPPRRARGLTLIELVMFIVIVTVAVAGVLSVMNVTTRHSVDPQRRKQALAIAEGLLEEIELARFTYCDPSDNKAATATAPADCGVAENAGPDAGEARPYDNVNDYVAAYNKPQTYNADAGGAPFPAGYAAMVSIMPATLQGIVSDASPANTRALRISVTVSYGNDSITLDGYRTRYDPNAVP